MGLRGGLVGDNKPLAIKIHVIGSVSSLVLSPNCRDNKEIQGEQKFKNGKIHLYLSFL